MNGLEAAINNALARGDRANAETRARIYQSARQALETGLRKQNISDPEFLSEQRHRLEVLIHAIEQRQRAEIAAQAAAADIHIDWPGDGLDALAGNAAPVRDANVAPEPEALPSWSGDLSAAHPAAAAAPLSAPSPAISVEAPRSAPSPSTVNLDMSPRDDRAVERPSTAGEVFGGHVAPEVAAAPQPMPARDDAELLGGLGDFSARDNRAAPAPNPVAPPTKTDKKGRKVKPAPAPRTTVSAEGALDFTPDRAVARRKRRGGFFSRLFVYSVLFAAIGIGAWWAYHSGLLLTAAERDTNLPTPQPNVEAEDFTGTGGGPQATALDPRQGFSAEWKTVFSPDAIGQLRPHANAAVETVNASDGAAVRLTSRSSDEGGDVEIPVPVELMRDMAGKTSTLAITLQSASDTPVQVSVRCDFNLLGSCPRHRVTVNSEKSDILVKVAFDRSLAPSKPGMLLLNGDVSGRGHPVRLYSVRLLPGQ